MSGLSHLPVHDLLVLIFVGACTALIGIWAIGHSLTGGEA